MRKTIILSLLAIVSYGTGVAQKKEFIEEYTYTAGDRDSKDDCYDITKAHLRSMLLDKIGVYVRSESTLKTSDVGGKFTQDYLQNIATTSAGITDFKVIDQRWTGSKYWMKAAMKIDTTTLHQYILSRGRDAEMDDMRKQIASMKKDIEKMKGNKVENVDIKFTSAPQLYTKQVLIASHGEALISLKLSKQNGLLFVTTSTGRMIVLNNKDSIIKTYKFKIRGAVSLDYNGEVGAYSDEDNNVFFFNQKTLALTDTVQVTKVKGGSAPTVWFTKSGRIFISKTKNVYRYGLDKTIQTIMPSYTILDYDYTNDKFLLGYWDESMVTYNRKIKKLFICDVTNLEPKKHIMTTDRSFVLYSYFFNEGSLVITYDGKGNYYRFNTFSWQKNIIIQDTITNPIKKESGLSKIDDNTLMVVKNTPIEMTPENIEKYAIKPGDVPTEFIFKRIKSNDILRSMILLQPVYDNNIVINTKTKSTYYLTSESTNRLISIR